MELKPNCGSDRAWVWTTQADYADEEVKEEVLAIRFANAESKSSNQTIGGRAELAFLNENHKSSEKKNN